MATMRNGTRTIAQVMTASVIAVSLSGCPLWRKWLDHHDDGGGGRGGAAPDSGTGGSGTTDAGPADVACGSRGLPDCPAGQYCNFPEDASCGDADQPGTCAERPTVCTRIYAPVCGCDGTTYGNACEAAAAGVSVRMPGECADGGVTDAGVSEGDVCGGLLGVTCPEGEYCDFAQGDGCDVADGQGRCVERPEVCTDQYDPVCTCAGETYGNACAAAADGQSVRSTGECDAEPSACGGLLGLQCAATEFCDYAPEALCGRADATGTCMPRPELCTQDYTPVCGCDGQTYSNRCTANAAGLSVETAGECASTP